MPSFLRPAFFLALLAAPLLALAAPPEAATEHVKARLVSSQAAVAPGQRFTVALAQDIKSHWHTYWLNPGDSGQATSITWTGAEAGPIQWPTPSVQAIGPLVNYGYEGRPALLVELTVPADAKPGGRFQPGAEVRWLVCKDVCIPEQVSLGLDLPVAAEAKAGPDAAQIEEWRRAIPKPAPFAVQVKAAPQGVQLSGPTAGVSKAYFFAETWGAVAHSAPQALKAEAADINPWIDSAEPEGQQPAAAPENEGAPKSATGSFIIDNVGPASLLDLINQSFEVMQTSLAQYKIAGYPPDVLINVPKRVCRFFEFYKAPELIALGREIASDTLDRYEREQN